VRCSKPVINTPHKRNTRVHTSASAVVRLPQSCEDKSLCVSYLELQPIGGRDRGRRGPVILAGLREVMICVAQSVHIYIHLAYSERALSLLDQHGMSVVQPR